MFRFPRAVRAAAAALALSPLAMLTAPAADAAADSRYRCEGSFAGVGLNGVLSRTWYPRTSVWSYSGAFSGADGARYDFEVNTNRQSGVGGAWRNHARHRETHIRLDLTGGGFVITDLNTGRSGRFSCG